MAIDEFTRRRVKVSRGGQISVPAAVRHRWRTSTVTVEDRGDELVIRPAADDPIAAAAGAFAGRMPYSSEELRRLARDEDQEIEDRQWGRR